MKQTCMNCKYYCGCLADESSGLHIHNYCFAWKKDMSNLFKSDLNSVTNDLCDVTNKICMYDDLETGEAYCYNFKPTNPYNSDEWFENNKKENIKVLLSCVDELLEDYSENESPIEKTVLLELKEKYKL